MRRMMVGAVFAAACVDEPVDTGTGAPWVAPLAPPFVAIAASTFDGAFRSTCTMSGSVIDADGVEVATLSLSPADGGRWAAIEVDPGEQRKLVMSWNDCVNNDNGTGEFTSGTFSGNDGDLFVGHYNGSTKNFESMVQATDHLGGEVHAQFDSLAMTKDIDALVADLGLTSAADPDDDTFRYLSWTDDKNVASVLASLSAEELYLWGEPTWVEQPAWW